MNLPVAVRGHPGHRTIGGGFDVLAVDAWANMTRNGLHLGIRDTPRSRAMRLRCLHGATAQPQFFYVRNVDG